MNLGMLRILRKGICGFQLPLGPGRSQEAVKRVVCRKCLGSFFQEEGIQAFDKFGAESVLASGESHFQTYRELARKYPDSSPGEPLTRLVNTLLDEEGRWLVTVESLGLPEGRAGPRADRCA